MKPNSSGRLQPYDTLGQYASPGGGSGSGTRGNGWIETSGQGRGRGTSLLSMGGGVLDEDAPEQPGPRRNQGRRKSLLSAGAELLLGNASEEILQGDSRGDAVATETEEPAVQAGREPRIYTYKQSTGEFLDDEGKALTIGYSGFGEGKNNPRLQHIPNVGPLTKGDWVVGEATDNATQQMGPYAVPLTPYDMENSVYQTSRNPGSFWSHGDSLRHPGDASRGCLVLPAKIRRLLQPGDIISVVE